MEATRRPRVKICCISSPDELTALQDPDAIVEQQRRCRANTLQLVDALRPGAHAQLRRALPGVGIVQVIHVGGPGSIDEALAVAPHVDALLLDSGNSSGARSGAFGVRNGQAPPVKELGGTGRAHDWAISQEIRELASVPLYLAGGLRPENVADAIGRVGPFGLDVCSGVRTDGRLDPVRLEAFFAAVAAASA